MDPKTIQPARAELNMKRNKDKTKRIKHRLGEQRGKSNKLGRTHVPSIELYQRESCPFSHAVRQRLSELGLDFVAHNVADHNDLKHQQLVQAGGKDQIPFLVDHQTGVKLYESDKIISYLDNEYGDSSPRGILGIAGRMQTRLRTRLETWQWRLRRPVEAARRVQSGLGDVRETLEGSLRVLRQALDRRTRTSSAEEPAPEGSSTSSAA